LKPVLPGGDSEAGSEAQRRGIAPEPIGLSNRRRPIGCVMGTGSAAKFAAIESWLPSPICQTGNHKCSRPRDAERLHGASARNALSRAQNGGTKLWIWQRLGCLERDDRVRIWNVPRSTTSNKGLVVRRGALTPNRCGGQNKAHEKSNACSFGAQDIEPTHTLPITNKSGIQLFPLDDEIVELNHHFAGFF
jgi:hypothetical protein